MANFRSHHTAISVKNLEKSLSFYNYFGFKAVATWYAKDGSLTIVHMALPDGRVLELFNYAKNADVTTANPGIGNDLEQIGVKHFGLHVDNLAEVREHMVEDGFEGITPLTHGRTRVDYFFVPDPDGYWVEVVSDNRELSVDSPLVIREE
jgi:catechol 2,3-dioxygenase-like lactoylglutathione lyase family enzyme